MKFHSSLPGWPGSGCRCTVVALWLLHFSLLIGWGLAQDPTPGAVEIQTPLASGPKPWTSKPLYNNPDNFQFVIVSDRTGGHRDGVFRKAIPKINRLRPEFVISVGDLIEGYTDEPLQIDREWKEFNRFLEPLDMRFFYIPGNHDIWDARSRTEWENRFGPSYYHFVYRDVLFLCLNSEDRGATRLSSEQIAYAETTLQANADVRWTLVFIHKPLWFYEDSGRETGWEGVEKILATRPHTVFAGHRHQYVSEVRNNYHYYQLATTGGGSNLAGPVHGRFDHVVWVTMAQEGPVFANLLVDGILEPDVRTKAGAELASELGRSFDLILDPVRVPAGETFTAAQTTLRIANRAAMPLKIQANFAPHTALRPTPHALELEVAAKSTETVPLSLAFPAHPTLYGSLILPLDTTATYTHPDLSRPLVWERTVFAVVERPIPVPHAPGPNVDGRLIDWEQLRFVADRPTQVTGAASLWSGPGDLSFRLGTRQDDRFLYLAVDVRDDVWIHRSGSETSRQDMMEVFLDARSESQRSGPMAEDGEQPESVIAVRLIPAREPGATRVASVWAETPDVEASSAPTQDGYAVELAIPHALLDSLQTRPWESLRLNLRVRDVDAITGSITDLWWRPHWNSVESYPGSGTFTRR